ncbi:NUMOD4 motif-containing HNH endonuclease [Myxococcus xanthus]|uniref:NUMOD4 motif-containing HNH endonuclease n=1 Tax=Myxococcus xanthus TaxID=34 RepID=UPI0003795FCC|nr:NUMOD4 motif-containing HNH endonuclease [Myxococcus xanthus]QVW70525.1 NUMOD4 motif-containing HNH endonuclease [Myxococcus xanthus DZ2]UEO03347.1 NUMOD4 motif-containing HNH endonuclease [Myxococcus xanthus DZ2]UYI16488.1 NUMOD4 motif-containing HNH endonuclease [Myxococcus xanthus]UYI23850.1 NUMOD4 motif-containing HNH endonuclease [Myxococcus xanthus]
MSTSSLSPHDEEWRPVPGFDGWYEVSNLGRVRSWRTRAKLCCRADSPRVVPGRDRKGYRAVKLTHPVLGKIAVGVHHLVLAAFVGPRPHGLICDHINANRSDNRSENLRWVTAPENIRHAAALGRMDGRPGARSHSPLTESDVRKIRRLRFTGERLKSLAVQFGVSLTTVSTIGRGRTWKEVQP